MEISVKYVTIREGMVVSSPHRVGVMTKFKLMTKWLRKQLAALAATFGPMTGARR